MNRAMIQHLLRMIETIRDNSGADSMVTDELDAATRHLQTAYSTLERRTEARQAGRRSKKGGGQ